MKLVVPVCNYLRREREEEIKDLAEHSLQYQNELTSYDRRQLGVDVVLRKHTGFKESALYHKVEADIKSCLQDLK